MESFVSLKYIKNSFRSICLFIEIDRLCIVIYIYIYHSTYRYMYYIVTYTP